MRTKTGIEKTWAAYICSMQGHLVDGVGNGTDPDSIVWADYCRRCGANLTPSSRSCPEAGETG